MNHVHRGCITLNLYMENHRNAESDINPKAVICRPSACGMKLERSLGLYFNRFRFVVFYTIHTDPLTKEGRRHQPSGFTTCEGVNGKRCLGLRVQDAKPETLI